MVVVVCEGRGLRLNNAVLALNWQSLGLQNSSIGWEVCVDKVNAGEKKCIRQRGRHKMPSFILFHSARSDLLDDKWDLTHQSTSRPQDMKGIKCSAAGPSID